MHDFLALFALNLPDPDRFLKAVAALLLASLIGAAANMPNPLFWIVNNAVLGKAGDRLDKLRRSRSDLIFRGFLLTAVCLFVTLLLVYFLKNTIETMPYYGLIEILALASLLSAGGVWASILKLYKAMEGKSRVPGAYLSISRGTRTNLAVADDYTITRVSIGFLARSLDKAIISPLFWYLLGGIPVSFVYSSLAFLAWRFGKDGFSKGLGTFPQAVEKIMGLVPNFISGLFLAVAALFTPTAGLFRSIFALFRLKNHASYEQGGFPLSAMAGALHISLGGASQDLTGSAIQASWVGPDKATAQNTHHHLRRALYIVVTAHILLAASLLGSYLWALNAPN